MTDRAVLTTRAATASVATAFVLLAAKLWATAETGSVALLGSLADTGLDLLASLVTFVAVRVAAEPADEDHRFGHGKAEAIAALFQTMLIGLSAALIAWRAGVRLASPVPVAAPAYGIGVSVLAIVLTLVLVGYQRSVARRTGSVAIEADSLHYASDLALNVAVIAAIGLAALGFTGADPLLGLGIALWLGWNAVRAARKAIDMLMDREWPELQRQKLLNMVAIMPDIFGIHELRTRRAGDRDFAQFHVWVDPKLTVADAHKIVEKVKAEVRTAFPGTEFFIHVDPKGHLEDDEIVEDHPCPSPTAT